MGPTVAMNVQRKSRRCGESDKLREFPLGCSIGPVGDSDVLAPGPTIGLARGPPIAGHERQAERECVGGGRAAADLVVDGHLYPTGRRPGPARGRQPRDPDQGARPPGPHRDGAKLPLRGLQLTAGNQSRKKTSRTAKISNVSSIEGLSG